ncbi:hypothetical protein UFOVP724_147 [uncultured Caudovirales phage]|uniref:Uncharacterized protein n=1 Tax=uncultured Caudovirales phage TaxID=2100421 RepID=A0A6J5NT84_9CAUD|nr:hypothetical protein UFOVP724_147 [uncultured Caudovirales phage]
MSISSILNQRNQFQDTRFLNKLKLVQRQFDVLSEESSRAETFKSQLESLNDYDEKMNDLISFPNDLQNAYLPHINSIKSRIDFITNDIAILYEIVNQKYTQYNSFKEDYINIAISLKKRIYQKLAIASYSSINFSTTFVESFTNLQNIDNTKTTCSIDTNNELMTLPIVKRNINAINDIYILQSSNGISGSFIDNKNGNLFYTIDGKDETIFEYNKLDEGPCILNLRYKIDKEVVLNEISIKTNVVNGVFKFKIDNILFENEKGNITSVFDLINTNEQKMIVNFYESYSNSGYTIKFLPILCRNVTFMFSQNEYVETNIQQSFKTSLRKLFSITLSEIQLITNEYALSGELYSKNLDVAKSMYMGGAIISAFPKEGQYYKTNTYIDDNKGLGFVELFETQGSYISDNLETFNYKVNIEKLNYIDQTRLSSNSNTLANYMSLNKTITSTNDFVRLNELFLKNSLIVGRPDYLVRREPKLERSLISIPPSEWVEKDLGWTYTMNINLTNINPEGLFISSPSNAAFQYIDSNTLQIVLNKTYWPTKPITSITVKWHALPYNPIVYENGDRYYVYIDENFEPNKTKIKLKNKSQINYKSETITKDNVKKVFKLSNNNISTNYKVKNHNANEYTINRLDGTIKFDNEEIDVIEVEYFFFAFSDLNIDDYDFWFKDESLKGISIDRNKVVTNEIVESLSDSGSSKTKFQLKSRNNIIVNSVKINESIFNYEKFSIIDYVNGKVEFSNLIDMNSDAIPEEEIDQEYPFIAFRLAKEAYYKPENVVNSFDVLPNESIKSFNLLIKDQQNPVALNGFICATDVIRDRLLNLVFILTGFGNSYSAAFYSIESGIGMFVAKKDDLILKNAVLNYSYVDTTNNNSNLVSIDYKNGYVYTNKNVEKPLEVKISYKTLPLNLEYSIYDPVDFDFIDGKIQYNAESKNRYQQANNQMVIYYAKEKSSIDIENNLSYFSPLIYSVKLGFN